LLLLLLASCTAFDKGRLDPRVAAQVMVSKLDPPQGCEYVGLIKGTAPLGDLGEAHGDVLRNAVLQGGNYVAVDLVERPVVLGLGSYVVRGRLFTCPASPGAPRAQAEVAPRPSVVDASASRSCEPECAAGFSCQLGACVAPAPSQAAAPGN
jgi:hypothetical protein